MVHGWFIVMILLNCLSQEFIVTWQKKSNNCDKQCTKFAYRQTDIPGSGGCMAGSSTGWFMW